MGLYLMLFLIQSIFSATANKKCIFVVNYTYHDIYACILHIQIYSAKILLYRRKRKKRGKKGGILFFTHKFQILIYKQQNTKFKNENYHQLNNFGKCCHGGTLISYFKKAAILIPLFNHANTTSFRAKICQNSSNIADLIFFFFWIKVTSIDVM